MRLWIVTQFYPPDMGAAAVRLSRLARLVAADGHDVTVLTVMPHYPAGVISEPYRGKLFHQEQIDGVKILRSWVYATPNKGTRARIVNQLSAMASVAFRGTFARRPDAILVESHPLFMAVAGEWLKSIKRVPVILNVSDLWPESAVETGALRGDSRLVKWATSVEKWAYRGAAQIVSMTDGVTSGILKSGVDTTKVTLIPNGVDLDRFQPGTGNGQALRERLGIAPDRVVALYIGNMSLTYSFEPIIDSAVALPEIMFLFVGGGSKEEDVRGQVAARGLKNVVFAGVLPHAAMPDAWAAGDLCLIAMGNHALASGTRPAKLYEALATGTPAVAAIRGEGATVVNESGGGIVVPVGDSIAYAEAIKSLADNSVKRNIMSMSGRAYAEANFSPLQVKNLYLQVIQSARNRD